jgi:hypothetical protein
LVGVANALILLVRRFVRRYAAVRENATEARCAGSAPVAVVFPHTPYTRPAPRRGRALKQNEKDGRQPRAGWLV